MRLIKVHYEVGKYYLVKGQECRFDKVTEKGYNFIKLDTNKQIFKRHIYPMKNTDKLSFLVPYKLEIYDINIDDNGTTVMKNSKQS